MNKPLTAEEIRETALDCVDDYLKRNSTESICFYNLKEHLYSAAGGQAKTILKSNRLVTERAGDNSITDLSEDGYLVIKYGGIRKFLEAKDGMGMIRAQNELLQNENLKFLNANRELDRDLKIAQANLVEQQSRELKHKTFWGIVGALGGALLVYFLDHFLLK
jgi:hypothetical protein